MGSRGDRRAKGNTGRLGGSFRHRPENFRRGGQENRENSPVVQFRTFAYTGAAMHSRCLCLEVLFLCAALGPVAGAQKKPKTSQSPTSVALPDEEVQTEIGPFSFRNLALEQDSIGGIRLSTLVLNGVARNGTPKTWRVIYFEGQFLNSVGDVVEKVLLDYVQIAPGVSKPLSDLPSAKKSVMFLNGSPDGGFRIVYKGGEIDTTYRLRLTKPAESPSLSAEDANITIAFSLTNTSVGLALQNKTDGPIKIDWNQVSFIDPEGTSHNVTHEGVKYTDANSTKPPTVVPPTARVVDSIVPADNVYYTSGRYGGWSTRYILPRAPSGASMRGKSFSVYLPLEINGSGKNYLFTFKIEDVLY